MNPQNSQQPVMPSNQPMPGMGFPPQSASIPAGAQSPQAQPPNMLPPKQQDKQFEPQPAPHQRREEAVQQLQQEIGNSNEILARSTSVFPLTLFPDTIIIDRHKMTITRRTFFAVAEVISVRIEDLLHVTANIGPFFGSIRVTDRFFENKKPYSINYLWRNDALRIKRILQGYIIATQKQIDCSSFGTEELAKMLDELGKSARSDA